METYHLNEDIRLICITAASFPEGIEEAHEKLHTLVSKVPGSTYYGISYPDKTGNITYKAAVNESFSGEAEQLGCESFVLKKGDYVSVLLQDFTKAPERISEVFRQLISRPDIDPQGCCVEMYIGEKDVRCMVRLD